MTPVDLFLSKLPDVKRTGKSWSARCPAHEDRRASLSVSEGDDGRALVNCHAGCEIEAVCAAIGLKVADLMPPSDSADCNRVNVNSNRRPPTKNREPLTSKVKTPGKTFATARDAVAELERRHGPRSAIWTYHDAKGEPVGAIVRWNLPDGQKDIRPVSRDGDRWRIGGMAEPRPLYELPTLGSAERVYVCEGEKAADAIRSLGLIATTSPHGCKSSGKADWRPLAGKEVILLPDNDASGRKYGDDVAEHLAKLSPAPVIKMVALPELPEKGDAADFVASRPTEKAEQLRRIVDDLAESAEPIHGALPLQSNNRFQPFPVNVLPEPIRGFVTAGAKAKR